MIDDTMSPDWNDAYIQGVADHPGGSCPYGQGSDLQLFCAWWAGWNDADRGLA